jgi:hypothetical protein
MDGGQACDLAHAYHAMNPYERDSRDVEIERLRRRVDELERRQPAYPIYPQYVPPTYPYRYSEIWCNVECREGICCSD